jgi:hypothetical protein
VRACGAVCIPIETSAASTSCCQTDLCNDFKLDNQQMTTTEDPNKNSASKQSVHLLISVLFSISSFIIMKSL